MGQQQLYEEKVIGGLINNPSWLENVIPLVKGEHFYFTLLGTIFDFCKTTECFELRLFEPSFLASVSESVSEDYSEQEVEDLLCKLRVQGGLIITVSEIERYARLVHNDYYKRHLACVLEESKKSLEGQTDEVYFSSLHSIKEAITTVTSKMRGNRANFTPFHLDGFEALQDLIGPDSSPVFCTGFEELDELIGGFEFSNLIVIGGRPGIGKTFFSLVLIFSFLKQDLGVAFWSMEMSKRELYRRIFSLYLKDRNVSALKDRYDEVVAFLNRERPPFFITENEISDLDVLLLDICHLKEQGVKVFIFDYVQLIYLDSYKGKSNMRTQELERITRFFKKTARDFNIIIIFVSQLSREYSKRKNLEPALTDLRDSGSIEQDSNKVLLLYEDEESGKKMCSVVKNREGYTGKVILPSFSSSSV